LKRGSMRFWLCASMMMTLTSPAAWAARLLPQSADPSVVHRGNETLLAGLRPGRDTFGVAEKRFKAKNLSQEPNSGSKEWYDACSGRSIRLEVNAKSVIQSVTISTLGSQDGKCGDRQPEFLDAKNWVTGFGLRIGDSQYRVASLYGEPNSSGPASKNGRDLALMYYQFDWAGSDVPQVMEVLCARDTGRVVEITLAFPSL
jgi:hypothetical protein